MTALAPQSRFASEPDARPAVPVVHICPPRGWTHVALRDLWAYREVFYFLVWRDLKVRYKQTALGIIWVVLQPVVTMLIFAVFFGRVMRVPSDDLPYALFAYAGLLPWLFFSKVVTQSASSVVSSANLITKIYFPRLLIPAAVVAAGLVDWAIAFVAFVPLVLWYGVPLASTAVLVPMIALLTTALALGAGFWLSSLNVRYRDIGAMLPLAMQLWMFATPIIYPLSMVPPSWRRWLLLNPLTGITEGMRGALFAGALDWTALGISAGVTAAVLVSGVLSFRRLETTFADVV
jgi:lipopolysaccharide transport system permease protein